MPNNNMGAVLVVEDDEHMRALLATMARQLGFQRAVEAASIAEALQRLEYEAIDMALIDLGLGGDDGMALIVAIRAHAREKLRALPIVVVSRSATEARILEAIKAGADGFIAKPLSMASFHRQVSLAFVKRTLSQRLLPEAPRPSPLAAMRSEPVSFVEID